jgi:hypothetical protein
MHCSKKIEFSRARQTAYGLRFTQKPNEIVSQLEIKPWMKDQFKLQAYRPSIIHSIDTINSISTNTQCSFHNSSLLDIAT